MFLFLSALKFFIHLLVKAIVQHVITEPCYNPISDAYVKYVTNISWYIKCKLIGGLIRFAAFAMRLGEPLHLHIIFL